jgi:hypothetical protein
MLIHHLLKAHHKERRDAVRELAKEVERGPVKDAAVKVVAKEEERVEVKVPEYVHYFIT